MKRLALVASSPAMNWVGGLYYIRNIAFMLTQNQAIVNNFLLSIIAYEKDKYIFSSIEELIDVTYVRNDANSITRMFSLLKNRVNIAYPLSKNLKLLGIESIAWIPDFQHIHFPELFNQNECVNRNKLYRSYADKNRKLILSSRNSFDDFCDLIGINNFGNVSIVPFVSYIEPEILSITPDFENYTLKKYNILETQYACIMNQFWQHKNHKVVLNAMKLYFEKNPKSDFKFVFTGKLEDYRCPEYIDELKKLFEEDAICQHSVLLGFIDKDEQIAIMKNAEYVIQPSLFEGWGTVLEDAKVLDKTVLLSDIPVHREQMNEKCILFDPHNPIALAKLIEEENLKKHIDNIENGIADMHERAKEYSKGFEQILKGFDRKK